MDGDLTSKLPAVVFSSAFVLSCCLLAVWHVSQRRETQLVSSVTPLRLCNTLRAVKMRVVSDPGKGQCEGVGGSVADKKRQMTHLTSRWIFSRCLVSALLSLLPPPPPLFSYALIVCFVSLTHQPCPRQYCRLKHLPPTPLWLHPIMAN